MGRTLAVVGAGNWGKHLVRNFYEIGVLHTICDANPELLKKYNETYPDVHTVTDVESLLNSPEVHQVVIAAPAAQHFSLAKSALEAGKDVYVEKPLCLDCEEGEKLVQIAEERQKILMVGHLLQYHPAFIKLKTMVDEGKVGEVKHIACHRLKLGRFRTEENVLWSFSPHDFSMVLSLAGEVRSVCCTGTSFVSEGIEDVTMTHLSFSGGVKAHIYSSWVNPHKEQKLVVIGTEGILTFDDTKPWEEKLSLVKDPIKYDVNGIPAVGNDKEVFVTLDESEPLRSECLHFLECCELRKQPRTCGREGVRVLGALRAAEKSLKRAGEKVFINQEQSYYSHPTAIVDKGAKIGEGTKIWHFCHILKDADIGAHCTLGQNVTVFPGSKLGNSCKVQNNASIYSGVICEDNVFIGPSAVFTNVINPRSEVNRRGQYLSTYICQGASIGANATILCGITIGQYSFIGAGAVVTKNTKPYSLMVGNPAKQVGWMSRHGEKLDLPLESSAPASAKCPETGEQYRLVNDQIELVKTPQLCKSHEG